MIQIEIEGVFLDLYDLDPPKITLSIEDILTTQTTTPYTKEFRVPATNHNSELFKTLFEVNGYDFDVSQERKASILYNGQEFQRGEIRINNIYKNHRTGKFDYGIIFIGAIRDFANSLGDDPLCNIDFSEFGHELTIANIVDSWDAYPETSSALNEGLFSGSVLYPLVDFGNTYDSNIDPEQGVIQNGGTYGFTSSANALDVNYFRPCIKAKDIVDKIFNKAGYTYTSNFLTSSRFRHLYVGAWGDDNSFVLNPSFYAFANNPQYIDASDSGTEIVFNIDEASNNDSDWDFINNYYVVPQTGVYDIYSNLVFVNTWIDPQDPGVKSVEWTARMYINGNPTPIATTITTHESSGTGSANDIGLVNISVSNYSFTAGDEIYITIEASNSNDWQNSEILPSYGINFTSKFSVRYEPSFNPGTSLSCDYSQIQFIKDLITKFRLVMVPDKYDPTNLIIEPWKDYIGTGDIYDWTDKLDLSKDIVLKPLFVEQKQKIDFIDKEGKDFLNEQNKIAFDEVYGTLKIRPNNNLLEGERKIETQLTPVAVKQIDGAAEATAGMDNTIIPHIYRPEVEQDSSGTAKLKKSPVIPGVRLFWYDGLKHTGTLATRDDAWYLTDGGTTTNYTKFPMISQFNEWGDRDDSWQGLDTQTWDLCWQRENTFIEFDLANPNLGLSVYDEYWSGYISLIYNRYSRRFTGYFTLSAEDLNNFKFDDVIFVKDTYFYVDKIYDAVIGQNEPIKVDLIKLINYTPPQGGYIPPGIIWNNESGEWNLTTYVWND